MYARLFLIATTACSPNATSDSLMMCPSCSITGTLHKGIEPFWFQLQMNSSAGIPLAATISRTRCKINHVRIAN